MTALRVLAALAALAVCVPAAAEQKVDLEKANQIASTLCVGCHGPDGNSPVAMYPSLAGQHAAYITKQLKNFKSGERANAIMAGMVATLTPEDMQALGVYYQKQPFKPQSAKNKELALQGQKIYRGGIADKGLPACSGCHAPNGAGIPAQYPRVAGQYSEYTLAQLKSFRAGERANDPEAMMRTIAAKMSDKEIQALAEYMAGLR